MPSASIPPVVHLDQPRCCQGLSRDVIWAGKVRARCQCRDRQALHKVIREGEESLEGDGLAIPVDTRDGLADREILASQIGDEQSVTTAPDVFVGILNSRQVGGEGEVLISFLDVRAAIPAEDVQGCEDGDVDLADVEGTALHEALQSAEREGRGACRQEGLLAGLEAQQGPEPAVLLALLANNR